MATYYKESRLKFDLLIKNGKPVGGKWALIKIIEKLPQDLKLPKQPKSSETNTQNI